MCFRPCPNYIPSILHSRPSPSTHSFGMDFPPELLDEIFGHLPPGYKRPSRTLMSCSLVSKAWLEPSRRLLFANASVSVDVENCQSWLDDISPTNSRLLHHVRSFTYFAERRGPPDPRYSVYTLREYLPSLYRLHTLTFRKMDIEPEISENLNLFSAFQHTLVSLSLSQVSVAWSAFVALIGHFPNIKDLEILWVSFETDGRSIPPPARALRGRLSTDLIERTSADIFIDRFPSLRLEYEELVIFWKFEPRLLAAVEKSLKYLKFVRQIRTSPASQISHGLNHHVFQRTSISRVARNFASWRSAWKTTDHRS